MGKITTFEILVDNRGGVVKAGETLRGQVLLELCEDMDVQEIRISFTGRSHVQWVGPQAQNREPMAELQASMVENEQAEEIYFSHLLTVFPLATQDVNTPRRKHGQSKLSKGSHMYDFEFDVPATCPTSFSGVHGYVRYMLKAVVERVWKVDFNIRTITVHRELDLNTVPEAGDSVELADDLHVYSLFFYSGGCHATLRLARKGYVPGDIIPVEFSVHNGLHQELHRVSLRLKMTVMYKAGGRKCTMEVALAKVNLGKVPAGKTLEGRERRIRVPHNCPPSGLPGCSIITVQYKLELKVRPTVLSFKRLRLTTDVIVGTTSLTRTPFHDSPPDYWSCFPPAYEDVMTASPWTLPSTSRAPSKPQPSATEDPLSPASPTPSSSIPHGDAHPPCRCPPPCNDEPRLTVLRQAGTPLREEGQNRQRQDLPPLVRPRANTGPTPGMARAGGR